jgi:hypothetical protein
VKPGESKTVEGMRLDALTVSQLLLLEVDDCALTCLQVHALVFELMEWLAVTAPKQETQK